ncbi:MAG: TA system VapC family ribonuclease toxin, partial [Candidatus Dormibacteraceae bacterium]
MILPDVNVLIYAFRADSECHEKYSDWLTTVVGGAEELALHDAVLTGLARIVTNPRIIAEPAPISAVLRFVNRLLTAPR